MTIPRMEVISAQWKSSPPQNVVVRIIAAALGVKFDAPKAVGNNMQELADLMGMDGFTGGKPDWLKAAEAAEQEKHG